MKKILSMLLVLAMVLSLAIPCAATEGVASPQPWLNVSLENPMEQLTLRGVDYPTNTHYPHTGGSLSFGGNALYSTLWLNKMVLGCSTYIIDVYNVSDEALRYSVCLQNSSDIQKNLQPHSSESFRVYADPNEILCMCFAAPSNFSGRIRCGC